MARLAPASSVRACLPRESRPRLGGRRGGGPRRHASAAPPRAVGAASGLGPLGGAPPRAPGRPPGTGAAHSRRECAPRPGSGHCTRRRVGRRALRREPPVAIPAPHSPPPLDPGPVRSGGRAPPDHRRSVAPGPIHPGPGGRLAPHPAHGPGPGGHCGGHRPGRGRHDGPGGGRPTHLRASVRASRVARHRLRSPSLHPGPGPVPSPGTGGWTRAGMGRLAGPRPGERRPLRDPLSRTHPTPAFPGGRRPQCPGCPALWRRRGLRRGPLPLPHLRRVRRVHRSSVAPSAAARSRCSPPGSTRSRPSSSSWRAR